MNLTLYPWQEDCLKIWEERHFSGIVHAVTGAGKTILALGAAEYLRTRINTPLQVIIVVPQTHLIAQWASAIKKHLEIPRQNVGYYYGLHKDTPDREFMIYVINSARYALSRHILERLKKGVSVLLIADECHHYASGENRKIFDYLPYLDKYSPAVYTLGLSATPYTTGFEEHLVPALGPVIYRYTFADAAAHQTINRFAIFNIALSFSPDEAAEYEELSDSLITLTGYLIKICPFLKALSGNAYYQALKHLAADTDRPKPAQMAKQILSLIYRRRALVYNADARLSCTPRLIEQLADDSRILIFSERIEQADLIYNRLNELYPNQVGRYHSQMEKSANKAALDRFKNREIRILVTCRALDEGFDVPSANVGIVLSSSSMDRQRTQRLGRILRNSGGKKIAALYYLYIENATDKYTYIADLGDAPKRTLFLSYECASEIFIHPFYEELAHLVLKDLYRQKVDKASIREARRCFELGICRRDWLLDKEQLDELVETSDSTREKNYWFCMKLLGAAEEKRARALL